MRSWSSLDASSEIFAGDIEFSRGSLSGDGEVEERIVVVIMSSRSSAKESGSLGSRAGSSAGGSGASSSPAIGGAAASSDWGSARRSEGWPNASA